MSSSHTIRILGIETSCDETGVAVVEDGRILVNRVASQVDAHAVFGGVVPEIASREHLRVLGSLIRAVLKETGLACTDFSAVAVARGPGLLGSLLIGVNAAKGISLAADIPLIGIDHLKAHLLAVEFKKPLDYPALGLLVSGGHTHLYLIRSAVEFELLGRTLDDAAGEAFDKAAKVLNLPYPGGALIDALAQRARPDKKLFTRPYLDNTNLDFSFSGLKTAFANVVHDRPQLVFEDMTAAADIREGKGDLQEVAELCASFNWAVADTLRVKIERALKRLPQVRSLAAAGGVAANTMMRTMLADLAHEKGLPLHLPELSLCMDNAAMIALAGQRHFEAGLVHGLDMDAVPRGRPLPEDYKVLLKSQ